MKLCLHCKNPIPRGKLKISKWKIKIYCDRTCATNARRANRTPQEAQEFMRKKAIRAAKRRKDKASENIIDYSWIEGPLNARWSEVPSRGSIGVF